MNERKNTIRSSLTCKLNENRKKIGRTVTPALQSSIQVSNCQALAENFQFHPLLPQFMCILGGSLISVVFSIVPSFFIFLIYQPDDTVFLTGISIRISTKWLPSPLSQVTETKR